MEEAASRFCLDEKQGDDDAEKIAGCAKNHGAVAKPMPPWLEPWAMGTREAQERGLTKRRAVCCVAKLRGEQICMGDLYGRKRRGGREGGRPFYYGGVI